LHGRSIEGRKVMGRSRIGISGWRYAPWRGKFYPATLVQREELHYASRQVPTIELNGSFYSLQRPESYAQWRDQTPRGFLFAVKGPRFITHVLRLRDIERPLANFFASGVLSLDAKLGPMLWQFPPNFRYDRKQFGDFLALLPRTTRQAVQLAGKHDSHLKHPAGNFPQASHRLRHAVEIRHDSFVDPDFIALLRRHGVALVVADTAGKWPLLEDVTAGFMYLRLHGDKKLYASGYSDAALDDWARRIRAWMRGAQPRGARRASDKPPPARQSRDVYCYFDNDMKVKAPFDAIRLRERLDSRS
jgi:uncharacterized protein YecE (DUF72 family)